jgi:hypothetical protein
MASTTPLAGITAGSASPGQPVSVVVSGVVETAASAPFSAGAALTWTGSGVEAAGVSTSKSVIGYAAESHAAQGTARVILTRFELP